jgi:ATP-binding cassette subfamily B protein
MYNVSPRLTLYTILPYLYCHMQFTNWVQKLTRGALFSSNIYQKYPALHKIFSGIRVIKAYSLEDQHQNNMVNLQSKRKSLNLAKYNLCSVPMLGLIGISNLVVIYFEA